MSSIAQRMARAAYSLLLRLLQPLYVARLRRRGRAEPLYHHAIDERLGVYEGAPSSGWVWLHAVSLGETRAAAALIDALRVLRPDMRLLLTHSTATGREAGLEALREGDMQAWLPYDTPAIAERFLDHFSPALGVLMETEVWPNLLRAAQARVLPMVLANARLSVKSHRQGQRLAALMRPAAQSLRLVLAQTEADAARLRDAGAAHVLVSGNLKFDMAPDPALLALGRVWRACLTRDVVLAAVTREGEEAMLLSAWQQQPEPRPLLLIVPRHPQRFDEVAALVIGAGFTLARRGSWGDSPSTEAINAQVWLGDSMREMALYYGAAHVALLGGSFAPLGGQNLIEAAACGCPVVMGPHTFNFAEAAEMSITAGAAMRAPDMAAAVQEALALLQQRARLDGCVTSALAFSGQHRGAAQRMAREIVALA